ncbi:MAG: hypothetical protein ACE5IH_06875, partial [Thermodesulfobacteriota bacterium]
SVGKVVEGVNLEAQREFLKKADLRFVLKERTLFFSWSRPFSFVAEAYGELGFISPYYSCDFKELKGFSSPGLSQRYYPIPKPSSTMPWQCMLLES